MIRGLIFAVERRLVRSSGFPSNSLGPVLLRERTFRWRWGLSVAVLALGLSFLALGLLRCRNTVTINANLKPDGTGSMQTLYGCRNISLRACRQFVLYGTGFIASPKEIPAAESTYADEHGQKLAARLEPAGPVHKIIIRLAKPIPPGGRLTVKLIETTRPGVTGRSDQFEFVLGPNWTEGRDRYLVTVDLPLGAELLGVDPTPTAGFGPAKLNRFGPIRLSFLRRGPCSYSIRWWFPPGAQSSPSLPY